MGGPSGTVDVVSLDAEVGGRSKRRREDTAGGWPVGEDAVQGEIPAWMRGPSSPQAQARCPPGPGCLPGGGCPALPGTCDESRSLTPQVPHAWLSPLAGLGVGACLEGPIYLGQGPASDSSWVKSSPVFVLVHLAS